MPKKIRVIWVVTCLFILVGFLFATVQEKIRANREVNEKRSEAAQKLYQERQAKKQAAMALEKRVNSIREKIASGDNDAAIQLADEILEEDPQNAKALTWRGVVLVKRGKMEEGLKAFHKSATIDPNWAKTYHYWGLTLAMQGKYKEAIDKYENALLLEPENSNSFAYWGAALLKLEDYPSAIEQLERSIGLNPKNSMPYGILIDAYYHQGEYDKAWKTIARAEEWKIQVPEGTLKRLKEASPKPVAAN